MVFCVQGLDLKLAGLLLMLTGWLLVLAAVILLPTLAARTAFTLAGTGVEVLGFILVARAHIPARKSRREA